MARAGCNTRDTVALTSPTLKAMILAAGAGTRLRPLTSTIPKSLIEIQGAPLVVHQIRWLKEAGIQEIVINVHHLADQFIETLGNGSSYGVHITFSRELNLLNTGGGIVNALPHLGSHPFLLLNGDVWTNYPFVHLLQKRVNYAHLVLRPSQGSTSRDFVLDGHCIQRCDDLTQHDLTYCGIALLHPRIFDQCQIEPFSLTRDLIFELIRQKKVTGEVFSGDWIDIGSPHYLSIVQGSTSTPSTKDE